MLNDNLTLNNSEFLTDQTFHQFHDIHTELDLHRIMSCFNGAFATGVACQQGTLTLPGIWFRPLLGRACAPIIGTIFLELAKSLFDFSHGIGLGSFSILLGTVNFYKSVLPCLKVVKSINAVPRTYFGNKWTEKLLKRILCILDNSLRHTPLPDSKTFKAKAPFQSYEVLFLFVMYTIFRSSKSYCFVINYMYYNSRTTLKCTK